MKKFKLLMLQTFRHGGADCIQIGENIIEYNNDFKFYIATESRSDTCHPCLAKENGVSEQNFSGTLSFLRRLRSR